MNYELIKSLLCDIEKECEKQHNHCTVKTNQDTLIQLRQVKNLIG